MPLQLAPDTIFTALRFWYEMDRPGELVHSGGPDEEGDRHYPLMHTWPDLSGTGNHLSATTYRGFPYKVNSHLFGGRPALAEYPFRDPEIANFNKGVLRADLVAPITGPNVMMAVAAPVDRGLGGGFQHPTLTVVDRGTFATGPRQIIMAHNASFNSRNWWAGGTIVADTGVRVQYGRPSLITAVFNGASSKVRINRQLLWTGDVGSHGLESIGLMIADNGGGGSYRGHLAALLCSEEIPTDVQIERAETYFFRKWMAGRSGARR